METILREGTTSNTRVEIITTLQGVYRAFMKQDHKGETDLLAVQEFKTLAGAKRWALKVLA